MESFGNLVMLMQKIDLSLDLGMKGLLFVELSVKESIIDAHSSLAALIKNPAWRLIEAVKTLEKF